MKINYKNFKRGFTQVVDFGFVFENLSSRFNNLGSKFISIKHSNLKKAKTFSKPKFTTGFTIAEVVVVIAIMAIITTVVLTSITASKKQSKDQKRVEEISSVKLALEQFYSRKKYYPNILTDPDLKQFLPEVPSDIKYAPLISLNSPTNTMCGSYHLYVTLESKISVLDDKKGFNSSSVGINKCIPSAVTIDASLNPLIYDVIPN